MKFGKNLESLKKMRKDPNGMRNKGVYIKTSRLSIKPRYMYMFYVH